MINYINDMTDIDNSYDIKNYTDEELYDILDLDNPNDRILEAKIVQMINKYSGIGGESGIKLARFFTDIYNHFFYNSDDEKEYSEEIASNQEEEDMSSQQNLEVNGFLDRVKTMFVADGKFNLREGLTDMEGRSFNPIFSVDEAKTRGFISQTDTGDNLPKKSTTIDISGTTQLYGNGSVKQSDSKESRQTILVNQLDYTKDKLNPLLKQTVKRIISIDSQYRDTTFYPYSTDFTFNLSEPLRDVVAIRMYSMQIPYSWYTINNNYGGNFFYLKGNSAGIDNGDFDYKISIRSGNYLPSTLITAVNDSITSLKTTYPDVSFGNTSITYDTPSNKSSIFIDIKNNFNESDYEVVFDQTSLNRYPLATDSNGNFLKYNAEGGASISSYFGFNNISYSGNSICTVNTGSYKLSSSTDTNDFDTNNAVFTLKNAVDNSNNYFTIYQYTGNSYYEASVNNTILFNTQITLNLNGNQTRNSIVNEINTQLANNRYLINSSLQRINITNPNEQSFGLSYFKLNINWNKRTISTANILNTKTAIVFPNESGQSIIWTIGDLTINKTTCFYFPNRIMEVNDIYAETEIQQTNYIINNSPSFTLQCITSGYVNSYNNYTVTVNNSSSTGYTLNEYLAEINNRISETNTNSIDTAGNNPSGIINLSNTKIFDDSTTDNKVSIIMDIAKTFKNPDGFYLDISNSELRSVFGLSIDGITDYSSIDLSDNFILTGIIDTKSAYEITKNELFIIKPKNTDSNTTTGVGNFNQWTVNIDNTGSYNLNQITNNIQNSIKNFSDNISGDSKPLLSSSFISEMNANGKVTFKLVILVNKILTEKDYKIVFNGNTWEDDLKFIDSEYNFASYSVTGKPYSQIFGNSKLSGYAYYVNIPQTITIKGITNGVASDDNSNDVILNIPAPSIDNNSYTIQQLFSILNSQLIANPITNGSAFSLEEYNNKKYVKLRLNINKLYTTNDYRVVFYDPFSFATCIPGQSIAKNVKWDSTLGWILGFREQTEYYLSSENTTTRTNEKTLTGDTGVIISLYNYFLLVLDDYTQSHLNDGLITISKSYNDIPIFNNIVSNTFQCVDNGNTLAFTGTNSQVSNNKYTQKQIYAENQKYLSKKLKTSDYTSGPFVNDVFALLPMKVTGLQVGATNVEFGGTLQNQERLYFGPVNIKRLSIKLLTDKGDVVDLNGQDWSFSFVCESLYQIGTVKNGGSKDTK